MEPLDWVREQGVVLQSARGPVPNLAEHVAGEPIRGSWWGHAAGHEIFAVLIHILSSPDVVASGWERLAPYSIGDRNGWSNRVRFPSSCGTWSKRPRLSFAMVASCSCR